MYYTHMFVMYRYRYLYHICIYITYRYSCMGDIYIYITYIDIYTYACLIGLHYLASFPGQIILSSLTYKMRTLGSHMISEKEGSEECVLQNSLY